jgi:hypothetical protein
MAFSIFREIRLSLLVGCGFRDYRYFYRDDRDYRLYEIDRDNHWGFGETHFAKFSRTRGVVSLLLFFRVP